MMYTDWLQCAASCSLHVCFVKISHFHRYLINIFLIYGYTVYPHQQDIFLTFIIRVSGATNKFPKLLMQSCVLLILGSTLECQMKKKLNKGLLNFNI